MGVWDGVGISHSTPQDLSIEVETPPVNAPLSWTQQSSAPRETWRRGGGMRVIRLILVLMVIGGKGKLWRDAIS